MHRRRDAGFTLIELIVVILIVSILAAIAVPIFLATLDQARSSTLQAAIANARLAVTLVVVDDGVLPVGAERDAILAESGDGDITLGLTGSGGDFCIEGVHAFLADPWASSRQVVPTQGATCAANGTIILP